MKKLSSLLLVSILGGAITLGSYKLFIEENNHSPILATEQTNQKQAATFIANKYATGTANSSINTDFTEAADKTVHAVVHVKNVAVVNNARSMFEQYYFGNQSSGPKKALQGTGSGVIITPDGYIVTNNHVIDGASELEVTLNNNLSYKAEVIGTDPQSDIALIKVDAQNLDYIPFADSDNVKIGDWALAVGNPFNLTSTVTAGIISAKGRDLNEGDSRMQSFIQTDAAINPGNSGGALVNTNGELIGINTAITSQTGSYIGYGFAVPSNNAKKIVEDILEYGDVQQAILGITGGTLNPETVQKNDLSISQGVYINSVSEGAEKAGLRKGDMITEVDGVNIRKFSDLNSYISTKRPGNKVTINYFRNGEERQAEVKLTKYETYNLNIVGVEITNATKDYLNVFKANYGVRIVRPLSPRLNIDKNEWIITAIDNQKVTSVNDVKKIMNSKSKDENTKITFKHISGNEENYVFRP
ncbi:MULTISPECIES: S1C family serine protease [Mesonia]|uniref:Periplasmic pH-dependent serine endoprotease DegQ n=1 Tax=Mesonia oceanica TaxID=2687242 RepID=A0AC61YCZ0_9FLAO|nr:MULTISPECIES: trypsin-like peptidase domain-containing protein [Mesonia]MAN26393.1 serine protease [Mesonia sp.]MAQ41774.1 serine protease [Mesonia sp.]MBJ98284.1 serine protease [Flavobacteriaceae bacterium]VVV01718.1 Periplasmic pH-dependent serine endoprotease DegQ [Mesonia oceanica]|tara:strand:+ start:4851 stop:6269 length:1419 start_codon:yes stop_codon:yes gene_type:complete